jgi:Kef-type K+ transport system membrane component KefB
VILVAMAGKIIGSYLGARVSRLGSWPGLALGAGLNARGVVEIVVAAVGLNLGVLDQQMYTVIVLLAIVTSLLAPPLLRYAVSRIPADPPATGALGGTDVELAPPAGRT